VIYDVEETTPNSVEAIRCVQKHLCTKYAGRKISEAVAANEHFCALISN
jgi:hypothetical protein